MAVPRRPAGSGGPVGASYRETAPRPAGRPRYDLRGMNRVDDTHRDGATARAAGPVAWSAPALLVATCGGLGRVPVAPGTAGAALGAVLALVTGAVATRWAETLGAPPPGVAIEACLLAAICLAGVPICTRAAVLLGRGKDPGAICYDEMAALPFVLLLVPPAARTPACVVAAFVLFRIFDIAKPLPCRRMERLPGGWGIMADDLAAAAWAAACLAIARACGLV